MDNKKKMLIVDDDTDLLKLYETVFTGSTFDVETISEPLKALEKIKNEKFDVILLDLMYPSGDNLMTIRTARTEESLNSKTPIIVLTNLDAGEKTRKALEYGANECLFKANFTPKNLLTEVVNILQKV